MHKWEREGRGKGKADSPLGRDPRITTEPKADTYQLAAQVPFKYFVLLKNFLRILKTIFYNDQSICSGPSFIFQVGCQYIFKCG